MANSDSNSICKLLFMSPEALSNGKAPHARSAYENYIIRANPASRPRIRYVLQSTAAMLGAEDICLEDVQWQRIKRPQLIELMDQMLSQGYSVSTCKQYSTFLRGLLHEARLLDLISDADEFALRAPIEWPHESKGEFRADVPDNVIGSLLAECSADSRYQGKRDAAIISLLYSCGLRRAESISVDYDSVDQVDWSISLVTKENKPLKKWIAPEYVHFIQQWVEVRNEYISPVGPLFTRIRRGKRIDEGKYSPGEISEYGLTSQAIYFIVSQRARAAGVEVSSRDLRKMYIMKSVKTLGVLATQHLADHIDVESTAKYVHITDEEMHAAAMDYYDETLK